MCNPGLFTYELTNTAKTFQLFGIMINPQEDKLDELFEAIDKTPYSIEKTESDQLRIGFNGAFKALVG